MAKPVSVRIAEICRTIEGDLSATWRTAPLAQQAGMAQHHFQRAFAATTGETVAGYVRSRRLERAALALDTTQDRIIDIAIDTGFQTHAALTRAFTAHFGVSPRAFRQTGLPPDRMGLPPRPYLRPLPSRGFRASCDLVEAPDQWLCWRETKGVRDGTFFADFSGGDDPFAPLRGSLEDHSATLCTAFPEGPKGYDDPEATALYGALCAEQRALDWSPEWRRVPGGLFAVFAHIGPFETLHLSWHRSVRAGFDQLGVHFRPAWMFETYLSPRPRPTEISALIYLPVQKSTFGKAPETAPA